MTTIEKIPINRYLSSYLLNNMQDKARLMELIIMHAKSHASGGVEYTGTEGLDYDQRVEWFKSKIYSILMQSAIEPAETVWGYCSDCIGLLGHRRQLKPLYRAKRYSFPGKTEIKYSGDRCKEHVSGNFWYAFLQGRSPDFQFFDQEKDFPVPAPLINCAECHESMVPLPGSTNSNMFHYLVGLSQEEAIDKDGNTVLVHRDCSYMCMQEDKRYVRYHIHRPNSLGTSPKRFNSEDICPTCFDNKSEDSLFFCERCDSYFNDSDARMAGYTGDYIYVCRWCKDNEYYCDDCEEWFMSQEDHDEDYDHDSDYSDDDDSSSYVMSYSYKPSPIFHGRSDKNLFFGLELEIEYRGNTYDGYDEGAAMVHNHFNDGANRVYLKHDGSLQNGFEIVTHPHTLEKFQGLDWSILDQLIQTGWRSWDTNRCGIHVHVSREAFEVASDGQRDTHQIKFIKLIYDNKQHVQRLAGRRSSWAKFDDKGKIVRKVKQKWQSDGRYSAVNVEPSTTIEVRVFKGSLRKERVLACIEFVHAAVEYTRNLPIVYTENPFAWTSFMSYVFNNRKTYPNLMVILNELMAQATNSANNVEGEDD